MGLIIATGSNIGNREKNLQIALQQLSHHFHFIAASNIYESPPVEYTKQPYFLNQVIEFKEKTKKPQEILDILLSIEQNMGRVRNIPKGPRIIDIDLIFYNHIEHHSPTLTLPHPQWFKRSFIVFPLQELPFYKCNAKKYATVQKFEITAKIFKTISIESDLRD